VTHTSLELHRDLRMKIACYNCGDWVESCTALVEHDDGQIELVFHDQDAFAPVVAAAA